MNENDQLTLRQKAMLIILEQQHSGITRSQLTELLSPGLTVSKVSVIRDLNTLLGLGLICVEGKGPATRYGARKAGLLLRYYDLSSYFSHDPDSRLLTEQSIGDFLEELRIYPILFEEERAKVDETNAHYQMCLAERTEDILRRERERFTIELAWKSSRIEGNTYSLLETEELIKTSREAAGHQAEEAKMILNHKTALDLIVASKEDFRQLSLDSIIQIHRLLVSGLGISEGIRTQPVGITGTAYQPPAKREELEQYLGEALRLVNEKSHPLEAAIIISAIIACLQPFSDGNKRTARLVGNALLLAHGYAALSYRSVDEITYKKSVLLVDEQHSLYWYKRLFLEQFDFAARTYFM